MPNQLMSAIARVWTQSQPEGVDCGECDGVEEGSSELVVACGDPAEILEAADRSLDAPAVAVATAVVADRDGAVAAAGDHRGGARRAQGLAEAIGVVGTVGDQAAARSGLGDQLGGAADVRMVAGGEEQHDRPAEQVGDQVDFGAPPTAGYANGLILRRFFWAPAAERCAFTWVLSNATVPPMRPASTSVA
jgi:hypothetical protein